jgi:2'-5' RNA ligase
MMRLFVAAYPPEEVLDHLEGFIEDLAVVRAGARVTDRSLWHVTLAFLGEVDDPSVPEAARAVDRAAEVSPCPSLRVSGGGRFDTIVWAGLGGDVEALGRVAATVRHELRASRLRYDEKKFRPHLTLARPGDRLPLSTVEADVARLARYRGPVWTVERIVLAASYQGPPVRYEVVHEAVCTTSP